jgi:hypothetical protein
MKKIGKADEKIIYFTVMKTFFIESVPIGIS